MSLPSREEFMKTSNFSQDNVADSWDKELFECPNCGSGVKRDFSVAYMTNPPKYRYFCKDCGYSTIF